MVSETKRGPFFPQTQFINEDYAPPIIYDRNSHGGSIFLLAKIYLQRQ